MKMNMYVPKEDEILGTLSRYKGQLPVSPEYPTTYKDRWTTLELEKGLLSIFVKQSDKPESNNLFSIFNIPKSEIGKMFEMGKWTSRMKNKTYVVGRNPGIAREAYYLSIKPDGSADKRDTDVFVPYDFSRIQFLIRDINEEITQITNVGYARKLIEIKDITKDESYRLLI